MPVDPLSRPATAWFQLREEFAARTQVLATCLVEALESVGITDAHEKVGDVPSSTSLPMPWDDEKMVPVYEMIRTLRRRLLAAVKHPSIPGGLAARITLELEDPKRAMLWENSRFEATAIKWPHEDEHKHKCVGPPEHDFWCACDTPTFGKELFICQAHVVT